MTQSKKKILMAMSGGIDSTASALLLKEQGFDVVGCTFVTRYTKPDAMAEAQSLAQRVDIEHHVLDLDAMFQSEIVDSFCREYLSGRTPNPCVLCNRVLKFGELLRYADQLGCDKIATGHYARIAEQSEPNGQHRYFLQVAKDERKDQTYFLWQLTQEQLARILFPLGDFTKQEVRDYLSSKGFELLSQKSESQDICFIDADYRDFLSEYAKSHPEMNVAFQSGNYVDDKGRVLGIHQGFANYTIGQRKGLGIALGTPAFVTKISPATNEVTIGNHDNLLRAELTTKDTVFQGDASRPVKARIRYRSHPVEAMFVPKEKGVATMHFAEPVWGVTPGQSCVMYQDNCVVGGGIIYD